MAQEVFGERDGEHKDFGKLREVRFVVHKEITKLLKNHFEGCNESQQLTEAHMGQILFDQVLSQFALI